MGIPEHSPVRQNSSPLTQPSGSKDGEADRCTKLCSLGRRRHGKWPKIIVLCSKEITLAKHLGSTWRLEYRHACVFSLFSCVRLFVTPWTVAYQAPLPMGFSRQECWSGLPCPPPEDLPNSGIKPRSPTLQTDSLASEPPGKPENTGMGSLSLLQQIFPTQGSNLCLLHCRPILYQLSYQGSPVFL